MMFSKISFSTIRKNFPNISDHTAYLDSAATTQKPRSVIDAISSFYEKDNATVHRAVYDPSTNATALYQQARQDVSSFIHASPDEIIFTRGATDGLNILADSFSLLIPENSVIAVSALEHHANLVPWQMAATRAKARLVKIPINETGHIPPLAIKEILQKHPVSLIAITHCSNVLGNITPIQEISHIAHEASCPIIVDGAQSIPHMEINVKELNCDAFVFSAHKLYGPTGIGVLYVRKNLLEKLPPTRGGGDMVETVSFEKTTYAPPPLRFEPGTPPIAEAIGLQAAISYLKAVGLHAIFAYESLLHTYLREQLLQIPEITLLSDNTKKVPLESFYVDGIHALDVASLLNIHNVYVRSGSMCCQPLLKTLSLSSVVRVSCGLYTSHEDIDRFIHALKMIIHQFRSSSFFASNQ